MGFAIVVSFVRLLVVSLVHPATPEGGMSTAAIALIILAFFLLSTAIAMVAVIAGIGGGVIYD